MRKSSRNVTISLGLGAACALASAAQGQSAWVGRWFRVSLMTAEYGAQVDNDYVVGFSVIDAWKG